MKFSPYYLVYGRDMRHPIEDDWKPNLGNKEMQDDEYEKHVKVLAERLQEANKVVGQQSKLSHATAKRYYDRQMKFEQFKKGDLVYVHDPVYKRGKAKKFSYQYKGPFEIEQRTSPLIYKVRMADGASAVLHVNRLKRAHEGNGDDARTPLTKCSSSVIPPTQNEKRTDVRKSREFKTEIKIEPPDVDIPCNSRLLEEGSNESDSLDERDVNLSRQYERDPEWTPGSLYLQKKLQSNKTADDIAYELRSRLVRSRQETEADKNQVSVHSSQEDENVETNMQSEEEPEIVESMAGHSYNLRHRV